jgi:TPR repeat protein
MKMLSIMFVIILSLSGLSFSQTNNFKDLLFNGKQLVEQGNVNFDVNLIMKGRGILERALLIKPKDEYTLYFLAYADYSLAEITINKDKPKAEEYLDEGIDYGKKALDVNSKSAETLALLGTIYGMKINLDSKDMMVLGPKSNEVIAEALGLAPDNPRVLLQAGINKMFTPEAYGGSLTGAVKLFSKAVSIFDSSDVTDSLKPDWGRLQSLAWLGRGYVAQKNYAKAVDVYKRALAVNPNYAWVKNTLLPGAEQKLENK